MIRKFSLRRYSVDELVLLFMPIFLFAEGLSKYLLVEGSSFYRVSLIIRIIIEIFIVFLLLRNFRKTEQSLVYAILILIVFFFIGQIFLAKDNLANNVFIENFILLNKYLFSLLIAYSISKLSGHLLKQALAIFYWCFIINVLLALVGMIFSVQFLTSYVLLAAEETNWRFGFNGLVFAKNEGSYFYIAALFLSYFFYQNKKSILNIFLVILGVFGCLIVGTKALLIGVLALLMYHLITSASVKGLAIFLISLPTFIWWKIDYLGSLFVKYFGVLIYFYKNSDGLIPFLLSGRNEFFATRLPELWEKWTFSNYFVGGPNISRYAVEMDFVDLFLFFGLIGSALYLFIFFRLVLVFPRATGWKFTFFYVIILVVFSSTSGHMFYSPLAVISICLTMRYFVNFLENENTSTR